MGCGVKIVDGAGNESAVVTISDSISVRSSGGGGGGGSVSRSIIASVSSIFGSNVAGTPSGTSWTTAEPVSRRDQQHGCCFASRATESATNIYAVANTNLHTRSSEAHSSGGRKSS